MNQLAITVDQILTREELLRAMSLYETCLEGTFAKRCDEEIITPVLARINATLGHENDSRFLAYAVEYVMRKTVKRPG